MSEAVLPLAQTLMVAVPELLTSLVAHPLLSTLRSHRHPWLINGVEESALASTAVKDGVDKSYGKAGEVLSNFS
ncbi:hypothetical protein C1H46_008393 [Malus baccata]|uniref:Uncharacterized protein n=1 Tax=Malus baccata TaxID=106549 RepID=A0A540N4M1_MALBA|nr:hypothetical protein C1H46_008393 [Malus baccata]